jgi:hypothetical protein
MTEKKRGRGRPALYGEPTKKICLAVPESESTNIKNIVKAYLFTKRIKC